MKGHDVEQKTVRAMRRLNTLSTSQIAFKRRSITRPTETEDRPIEGV